MRTANLYSESQSHYQATEQRIGLRLLTVRSFLAPLRRVRYCVNGDHLSWRIGSRGCEAEHSVPNPFVTPLSPAPPTHRPPLLSRILLKLVQHDSFSVAP
jgi:hypothetical protein